MESALKNKRFTRSLILFLSFCWFLVDALIAQEHEVQDATRELWNWANMQDVAPGSSRSPLRLDFFPAKIGGAGSRKWYFATRRTNDFTANPSPDFQLTVALYDSAIIIKLVEAREKTIGDLLRLRYEAHPEFWVSDTDSLIACLLTWKVDSLQVKKEPELDRILGELESKLTLVIPQQIHSTEALSYDVFSSAGYNINFFSFNIGANGPDGKPLDSWIDELYVTLREYIDRHKM